MHFIMIFIIKAKLTHCCWTEIASICSVYILQCLILKRKMVSIENAGFAVSGGFKRVMISPSLHRIMRKESV